MSGKAGREEKERSRLILGSLKAARSGPERGQRLDVTTSLFQSVCSVSVHAGEGYL